MVGSYPLLLIPVVGQSVQLLTDRLPCRGANAMKGDTFRLYLSSVNLLVSTLVWIFRKDTQIPAHLIRFGSYFCEILTLIILCNNWLHTMYVKL